MSDSDHISPTRVCVLTAPGRGAIAVVAVSGPMAAELVDRHFRAANQRVLVDQPPGRIVYGHWDGAAGEDLVVCQRGADAWEIHCHGGTQSAARIVTALATDGAKQTDWRDWPAFHGASQLEAEAQVALASAPTFRTAQILLDQYHGALRRELEAISDLIESNSSQAVERIEQLLVRAKLGEHLTRPWRVAIVGRPNVGKSTLINALVGYQRAIEFDQPGTTRDVVTATTACDGWPVELSDTAGLHPAGDEIELAGIAAAREQIRRSDLAIWLLDATVLDAETTLSVEEIVAGQAEEVAVSHERSRTLVVLNKCDLAVPPICLRGDYSAISASAGTGMAELIATLIKRLIPQSPSPGEAVPFSARQVELLHEARGYCRTTETQAAVHAIRCLIARG